MNKNIVNFQTNESFLPDDVTQKQLLVDPHQSRDLNLRPRPTTRFLADENVEDYANSLACGFCKQNLTVGDEGIIESPNYPDAYTANVNCLWLLETADLDDRIVLHCDTIELGKLRVTLAREASYIFSTFRILRYQRRNSTRMARLSGYLTFMEFQEKLAILRPRYQRQASETYVSLP